MRCSQAQISTIQISEYSLVCSLEEQGPQPDLKSKIKFLVLDLVGVFLKSGSNEVSFSRLFWSRCTGGLPTTGRRKSLHSLLWPWLAVSQIKTTNYDNVIGSLCGELGLPAPGAGIDPFFSPSKCQVLLNHSGHKHDNVNVQALLVKQFC